MRILILLTFVGIAYVGCQSRTNAANYSDGSCGGETCNIAFRSASGAVMGGNDLDEQDRKVMECASPRTVERIERGEPLTVNDIVKLHEHGISDETIIAYIHDTKTTYSLSQVQIKHLQNAGVSQRVINYMIDTGR